MKRDGMTVREATEEWVREMNAIPQGVIDKLMQSDPDDWQEVTSHASGDRVYVYDVPDGSKNEGVIVSYDVESDLYCVELYDSKKVSVSEEDFEEDFEVERYYSLPIWGTMWSFGDSADDD